MAAVVLAPLADADAGEVVANLLGRSGSPSVTDRWCTAAEGNPLFVEQLTSMLVDSGKLRPPMVGGGLRARTSRSIRDIPPTIQALIAARLTSSDPRNER